MSAGRDVIAVVFLVVVGAVGGWEAAGWWHSRTAPPPPPPHNEAPTLQSVVLDAEVFVDHGDPVDVRRAKLEATAKFLDELKPHDLGCRVRPALDAARGNLTESGGLASGAFIVLGNAYLTVSTDAGEGTLTVEGYQPVPIRWSGVGPGVIGACDAPIQLIAADAAVIVGVVRGADGAPIAGAIVSGCGPDVTSDADGAYYIETGATPCALTAGGAAPAVPVEPAIGEERVIDLVR